MASKSSASKYRFDNEIEKYRLELNWTKILDKLKTMKISENSKYLEGEAKLELYVQQYPIIDHRPIDHDDELLNSIEILLKKSNSFENHCLLAKYYYIRHDEEKCLSMISLSLEQIPTESDAEPSRISLILAEIYSLQGILFEKQKKILRDIILSFEQSVKLSQIYYSAMENAKHLNTDNLDIENSLIEIAYQRLPLLHASNNHLSTAIDFFRTTIENYQIKSLETMRQTLIKQFAQLLLKCVCQVNYLPIDLSMDSSKSTSSHSHRHRPSESIFVPRNVDEEICLLLYLGENSTLNEAVLDWQPEYEKQRERSHQSAYHLLALLAIFLSRKQAFHLIADSYEKALRFSFEHFQSWFNYGLALISSGQGFRAYLILKECIRMQPENLQVYLLIVKVILQDIYDLSSIFETSTSSGEDARPIRKSPLNSSDDQQIFYRNQIEQRPPFIHLIDEAIQFCEKAREISSSSSRVLLLLGLAKSFKARQTSIHQDRQKLFHFSIQHFKESIEIDPFDSLSHFHLAQNLCFVNEIVEAKQSIEESLNLSPDDKNALHLYTLILTSEKLYGQAYQQIYRATNQYSDISLLLTKARLEEDLYGYEQSIRTCKDALTVWKKQIQNHFYSNEQNICQSSSALNRSTTTRSQNASMQMEIDVEQGNPSGTLKVDDGTTKSFLSTLRSLTNLFVEDHFHAQRSSTSYFSLQPISFRLIQIFDYLVRYYIELDQIDQSEECLKEISSLNPYSYQIYYLRAFICEARGQNKLAKQFYNDALSINPSHYPTLIQLTKLLIQTGNYSLAEKYARDAIAIQPSNYQPWYLLGLSMEARGEYQQSIDVSATAVHLEGQSPLIPYESIIRVL